LSGDDLDNAKEEVNKYFREEIGPFANRHQKDVPEAVESTLYQKDVPEAVESMLYQNDVDEADLMTSFKEIITEVIKTKTRPWRQGRLGYLVGTAPDTQDLVL
jgi:hypothetical protein